MSTFYQVHFINNSTNMGNVCVFQQDPDMSEKEVMSLAWFSKKASPTTRIKFKWQIDYSFVWAETGVLAKGVVFDASQVWNADLSNKNQVTLSKEGGAYGFKDLTKNHNVGSLHIKEDATVPLKMASVGIGMSGKGTFVVQAQPNQTLTFVPKPSYYIAFGNYQEGEVLDVMEMTDAAKISFPYGVFSIGAVLNEDNTWTIKPLNLIDAEIRRISASN